MSILIIYTTKHGTVEKSVNLLREKFSDVDVVNVLKDKVPGLSDYSTVVIGGSIYMGRVQKELTSFMETHLETLLSKKVGLFLCAGHPDQSVIEVEFNQAFPQNLIDHAVAKEVFGYELDFAKMNMLERFIIKKVHKVKESQFNLDETKITHFANKLR
ncbi:flavodoxin domain-containing protein [Robertmurraya sp. P23]|uniref:flavodoxin domain-containing protein n=1 Tax=Robertmurraya sp. P23 TaxID=3436931 RepID=UPI003D952AAE